MIFAFRLFARRSMCVPPPARFRRFDDLQKLARNLTEKRRSESMKRNDERGTMNGSGDFFIDPFLH